MGTLNTCIQTQIHTQHAAYNLVLYFTNSSWYLFILIVPVLSKDLKTTEHKHQGIEEWTEFTTLCHNRFEYLVFFIEQLILVDFQQCPW